ncbi:hypothetical protein [Flavobacterium sp. MEB061]|uniref:hypothetical protein n=1 Tax=Flavobacterium sp. MEB061 TaxID=1587524 RepID=UPI000698FF06|nr:hypothetical protein [Flavobacterium sp. MEB061]
MKNFILFLLSISIISCTSINDNKASKLNDKINESLFALKGYQPIDPISINDSKIKTDTIINYFPNEAARVAVGTVNKNGTITFGPATIAVSGQSYTVIIDYIKYHTTSIPARYSYQQQYGSEKTDIEETLETQFGIIKSQKSFKITYSQDSTRSANVNEQEIKIPVYVGVGLRIQANITVLKDSVGINLGSLYNLGVAASQNKINGTLIIQTLGISGKQISSAIPIPDKINESTIQNAIISLATIKSKLYDNDTRIKAHVVGFGLPFNMNSAKDLIEATLHSNPPTVTQKTRNSLVFEEYFLKERK